MTKGPTRSHGRRATAASLVAGLVAAVALLAAGCGSSNDAGGTTESTTVTDTTPAKAIKVGLITDLGQLNDNGFNEGAYNGLKRAERVLGVKGRVVESASAADYIPNMSTLAKQGYDLIIGVGFAQGDAIATTAKKYPDTSFAIVDVDQASLKGKPANVVGLLFREEQVGYLTGYLAALEAKRAGANRISAVGGFKEPPVDRYIAGYFAGAEKAAPGIKLMHDYSQDWDDQAKCKELALNQIARGSNVIFQVAGGCGLGAIQAAKESKGWGIGVDADQFYLGKHILTSALKKVDVGVFDTIKLARSAKWKGGVDGLYSAKNGGVGVGKVSTTAPRRVALINLLGKWTKDLASGKVKPPSTVK